MSAKNLDALLRGPAILLIASSVKGDERDQRVFLNTLAAIAIVLGLMGVIERILPLGTPLIDALVRWYGGPIPADPSDLHAILGVNHKGLCLENERATGVFPTAPALGMAALYFLTIAVHPGIRVGWVWRAAVISASLAAGLACNSKSFIYGVPLIFLLALRRASLSVRQLMPIAVFTLAFTGAAIALRSSADYAVRPIQTVVDASSEQELDSTYLLTGGRLGGSDWSVLAPLAKVLDDAPVLGYGLGEQRGIFYADSQVNRILLHGGLLGILIVALGIGQQWYWFRIRPRPAWSAIGRSTLLITCALFFAGAVFLMPRVNDIIFSIVGLSLAATRHRYEEAAQVRVLET